jgi:hypothetical protein
MLSRPRTVCVALMLCCVAGFTTGSFAQSATPAERESIADWYARTKKNQDDLLNGRPLSGQGACKSCPQACELTCGGPEDRKCLAELAEIKKKMLEQCAKRR